MAGTQKTGLIDIIRARIDERLRATGLSAKEASERATGRIDTVATIKRGRMPGVDKLIALSRVLGCTLDDLTAEPQKSAEDAGDRTNLAPPGYARFRRCADVEHRLREIDLASIRPLRTLALSDCPQSRTRLERLERDAAELRDELAALTGNNASATD